MAVFTVHQPPLAKQENMPDPARFTFVRDGFYVWGFVLTVFWMLRHRLWLVATLFAALTILILVALYYLKAGSGFQILAVYTLAFLVGLEGATLRRWTLNRRGWTNVGVVVADNQDDAERRFFANWLTGRRPNAAPPPPNAMPSARMPRNGPPDVIGSFPQPDHTR